MEGLSPERLRASNADRERVLAVLREAVADGRLDLEEFQERSDPGLLQRAVLVIW